MQKLSQREVWSWYGYDFATQPFCSASVAIFIPLILETLAYDAGHLRGEDQKCLSDRSLPGDCTVWFLGNEISPVSFALYVFSISVALQVFFFISLGTLGDHGSLRKTLLTVFTILTGLTSVGFLAVVKASWYYLAAVLTIVGNVCYGIATVMYYSYLPVLVDCSEAVQEAQSSETVSLLSEGSQDDQLEYSREQNRHIAKLRDETSNKMSVIGTAMGNMGAVSIILIVGGLFLILNNQSTYFLQGCVALTGVWALVLFFALVFPYLNSRPGPPMPEGEWFLSYSWKKIFTTLRKCFELKHTFLLLISWFFLSDGFNTIVGVSILFGKSSLHMDDSLLLLVALIAPIFTVVGNMFFLHVVSKRLKLSSKSILVLLLGLGILIPLYGLLGFVLPQHVQFGLRTVTELFIVAAYFGFLFGSVQSYSRSLFSSLIPPSMESELFGLFQIGDKGSSWLGPLLIGLLTDVFGDIRYGFFAILALLLIAIVPLAMVNPAKGREDAQRYSHKST